MTLFEERITGLLIGLLKNEPTIRSDAGLNLPFYLRFQPQFLYDLLPRLKKAGMVDDNDDLSRNLLFLFEFSMRHGFVTFDCKINWKNKGVPYNEGARRKLFEIYGKYPRVFTQVLENDGKLKEKWHPARQRKILTKKEFGFYEQNSAEDVSDLLECRFRKVIDIDLPAIEEVFHKELK